MMNEEEIRGKLLLPFLNDLGFNLSEISLEKSFIIRLGKSQHTVQGRSDILCKRNGKNLFIIELKNDSVTIGEEDIDQGISYARLLTDNIAPFTIVTNGKATRVFDSISREELNGITISKQSSYWRNGCSLSMDTDLRVRYEALKKFVSFSAENLKVFCEYQVRDRMGPIIGNIDNPHAKFVKELHVQRQGLHVAFSNFLNGETSMFGIVGAAGVGKTSAMCSLALQRVEDLFVFFYNAAIVNKSPLEHIAQDLNGFFSSKSESELVLKKLDDLGEFLNKRILIFIDAIDENADVNLSLELSEIALIVRNLKRVKVCISCKANVWNNFLKQKDTPNHLFEELSKSHTAIPKVENCPGFLLEDFSNDEMTRIVPLYKEAFGFKGQISKSLLIALRNGFFLRIFSEVYSNKEIPEKINDRELIPKYLKQSLEKTSLGVQIGTRILSRIGEILITHKFSSWDAFHDKGIKVESLVEKLDLPLDETLPEDLYSRNLLIKSNEETSYTVSFYFSKIRDYIICYHSYRLDKLNDEEFYDILDKFYENHIGQSAIDFYKENASAAHLRIIVEFIKDKCLTYVTDYNDYLEKHFRTFKDKFDPQTKGEIGIFLPKDLLHKDGYALFPLSPNSANKIQHERLDDAFSRSPVDDLFFQKGARILHSSNKSLLAVNQSKTIKQDVFKQLKEIVNKGQVSVYNSDVLLLEQVSTIIYYYYEQLGYNFDLKDYYFPRFDLMYPIDLQQLKNRIYKFLATEYYKREKWYSGHRVESTVIADEVSKAVQASLEIPKLNITGDFPPFEELQRIVDILIERGYSKLTEHHLPCPNISIAEIKALQQGEKQFHLSKIRPIQFSAEQAKLYIETFLKHFDACYKAFVECLFPTLKDNFTFYEGIPHEYFLYMKDSDVLKWGYLGYRTSESGEVRINYKDFSSSDKAFENRETHNLHGFTLDQILHNDHHFVVKTIDKINTPKVDEFCVLRNWVFKFLKDDLRKMFKENDIIN
jgi:hypothetical protein